MSKLGSQLREIRKAKRVQQQDLARAAGLEQATLSRIEAGKIPLISPHLAPLAQALGVQVLNPLGINDEPVALQGTIIPVWEQSKAARIASLATPEREAATQQHVMSFKTHSAESFAIVLEDDSMAPRFVRGNFITADPKAQLAVGKFVIASQGSRDGVVFRQYASRGQDRDGNDLFELIPLNNLYPVLRSDRDALVILGVACERVDVDL